MPCLSRCFLALVLSLPIQRLFATLVARFFKGLKNLSASSLGVGEALCFSSNLVGLPMLVCFFEQLSSCSSPYGSQNPFAGDGGFDPSLWLLENRIRVMHPFVVLRLHVIWVVAPLFTGFGALNDKLGAASSGLVGENDLLIVGPGVLGRLVAKKWRQEHPGCQVYGQTVTTDHHDDLIKIGINPSLKGTKLNHQFPYVIFCAPPSRTSDYIGDVREAALSWNGEGCFLFTSSSAPYDCNNNGQCDEDSPVVPFGRSPRTDVLLKAEKVVLESSGCVLRLAGLYISFLRLEL
ncbi:hypothetical protein GH714_019000 [Hevea brasiliensis]|uniref:Uncharacterized protein n=1 Tax=Hevea brasiliensis TaxID=3981 RepID=A0A6A6MF46_HEVBR|nr:hypothetical protein GH714_019000 [Hevea brasiliensis]